MKKSPSLDIASLALNLDGCRFGDTENRHPNNYSRRRQHHHHMGRGEQPDLEDQEKQQQQQQQSLLSPLSTHHRHHLPQYRNTTTDNSPNNENYDNYCNPPTPQGCTYRFDNLSIGHNFLRHHGVSFLGHPISSSQEVDNNNRPTLDNSSLVLEECIGRGNCSSVWKARRRRNDTAPVAIASDNEHVGEITTKQVDERATVDEMDNVDATDSGYYALKFFSLRDPEKRMMLLRELKLLCTFQCECLVELQGAFLDIEHDASGNTVVLVLEYMDLGSVADLLIGGDGNGGAANNVAHNISSMVEERQHQRGEEVGIVPEYAIASIAYQILWGLSYLHYEGVLHRDIKPANVLISSAGRVKLADFGIVSRQPPYENEDGTVLHHTVIGTVRYMSPERLHGRPYTRSSDVWSIGLLLLEIVRGGCSPFQDVSSVVELVQTLDECKMSDYIPQSTSDGLREILLGCLCTSPHKRIPASILLQSPWFQHHGINSLDDTPSLMRAYLESCFALKAPGP